MKVQKSTSFLLKMSIMGIIIISLGLSSCKRQYAPITSASVANAEFVPISGSFINSYYVTSANTPYLIPVGLTNKSNSDRTVSFTASSNTAVAGQQYTVPTPVTIKAGEVLDTLRFNGIYSGYSDGGRKDTVTIKFSGYPAIDGQDSIQLVLQQYCDVIGNDLIGNYEHITDLYSGTSYTDPNSVVISNWKDGSSSTTATISIQNLGIYIVGASAEDPVLTTGITATLDWTNPSNFKVTIPSQAYGNNTGGYGPSKIVGSGSFSSCSQTFTLTYTITVSAGSFGSTTTTVQR
ncbi:MAG: hypothetical protein PW786_04930 [Arachidicoccus sp.]|nr:hypothetical protein [Arachidicoccus sp.]